MAEQTGGEIGDEKEQMVGDGGVTITITGEDVVKVERNDGVTYIMEQRGEESNELEESDGDIGISCCCWCTMLFSPFSIVMPFKAVGAAPYMDYDQEFGRETNRNDYFAIRSLDGEDLSGGGGVARSLSPETGSGAASEKLIGGEGRPPPWWKKYWLKLTGRS